MTSEKMQQQGVRAEVPFPSPTAQKMTSFALVTRNELFQPDFRWTINDIAKLTQSRKFKVETKSLEANQSGYQCSGAGLSVEDNGKVRVWLSLKNIGPSNPQIFFLIRDRSGASEPQHVCASMHTPYKRSLIGLGRVENKSHAHESCLTNKLYNVDDSLVIDFYVEPSAMAQHAHSYDGNLNWAIDNFRKRQQIERDGLIEGQESPYLYTSPKGYRVQLKLILQGAEEHRGKGPSVEVRLLRGKWDKELDKSFPHHVTLTLLNRSHPSANIERNVEWNRGISKRKRCYVVHLCSEQRMESLVESDTLYYRVTFREKSKVTNYYGLYTGI